MNYEETLDYLFHRYPAYESNGASAYKPGLDNTRRIDETLGHPHKRYRTIHIAGTNGKGSVSSLIASVLTSSGLKVGLYTSPHIVDFRERIRVNGEMIDKGYVVDFVKRNKEQFADVQPSFFEATMEMAFKYFADMGADVAVIETGLGGRLDSTNIISPDLAVITNISMDHTDMLGDTLEKIAGEKAGIIKEGVPVVIGEKGKTAEVFREKAKETGSEIYFAEEVFSISNEESGIRNETYRAKSEKWGVDMRVENELKGEYQIKNTATALTAIEVLKDLGYTISEEDIEEGFRCVAKATGLTGRWQTIGKKPLTIADMGHNEGAIRWTVHQIEDTPHKELRIVFGMVKDKDIDSVLSLLPKEARYYFCNANTQRALPADDMEKKAEQHGLKGKAYENPREAYNTALSEADDEDMIYVGGSAYVLGEILSKD